VIYYVYTQCATNEINGRTGRTSASTTGISFELAALVFEDEFRLIIPDRVDEFGERRWHAIGAVSTAPGAALIVLVAHAYRHPSDIDRSPRTPREDIHDEEIIRIISARRAGKNDVRRYQEQEVD
jgi:uncharacterized DUF497 family protein